MTRFWTSDWHFSHRNVITYCNRPWFNVNEMNSALIAIWNSTVTENDTVYFLGDFSLNPKLHKEIVPILNGYKILVPGNHDKVFKFKERDENHHKEVVEKFKSHGWNEIHQTLELDLKDNTKVLLSHLPYSTPEGLEYDQRYKEYRPDDKGMILLHGHVHCRYKKFGKLIDVGIDDDFTLLSEDKVIEFINDGREFIPSRLTEFYKERKDDRTNMKGN